MALRAKEEPRKTKGLGFRVLGFRVLGSREFFFFFTGPFPTGLGSLGFRAASQGGASGNQGPSHWEPEKCPGRGEKCKHGRLGFLVRKPWPIGKPAVPQR